MTDLPKQYEAAAAEARWMPWWETNGYFDADPQPGKVSHTIMIPLPNVTGALHMGHALNGTLQDLITRWKRMQGFVALWMPGTDHAGIATQAVVERRMLEEEGLTRHDVGREALVERIWKWKDQYEKRIIGQLKRLGASCDWRRVRFTLDDVCSQAVRETFFKMFRDGLIYRGKRLVNWDTFLQTAVADDEVYTEEIDGQFWTMNYPVVDENGQETGERISFSTTRPETMLGDTAVCVHPTDERYLHLIGKNVRIPLNGRLIPIIADALLADKDLGTGCVKVTPAHDPNDYACGLRNKLEMINILNPDGTLNDNGGEWKGQDRLQARTAVVARMEHLGHFEKVEDRKIPMKFSDRSKTPVEPYLSDQWFVKMGDLAQPAIDAVTDGRVQFFPDRYKSSYLDWLGEKRDWCISRQLWWGHRIPVWMGALEIGGQFSDQASYEAHIARTDAIRRDAPIEMAAYLNAADITDDEYRIEMSDTSIKICPRTDRCEQAITAFSAFKSSFQMQLVETGKPIKSAMNSVPGFPDATSAALKIKSFFDLTQDPDVLDTWFSSALWPHATLGWPDLQQNPPMVERETNGTDTNRFNALNLLEQAIRAVARKVFGDDCKIEAQIDRSSGMPRVDVDGKMITADELGKLLEQVASQSERQKLVQKIREMKKTSSSLLTTHHSPLTTTNEVLPFFYPGSVLITSRDIITLWVARMVLTGLYNMKDIPFKHVHVHPKILDGFGQGMSKSKGNGVDPLELIERYGCDGMRFTIASFAGETQDVRLPVGYECPHCQAVIPQELHHLKFKPNKPRIKCAKCKKESQYACPFYEPDAGEPVARVVIERFEYGRNFSNKLWNAARFAMLNLEGYTPGDVTADELHMEDCWILSRLATVTADVTAALEKYQFDQATRAIREFVWNEFCDWYLEMIKPRLRKPSDTEPRPSGSASSDSIRAACQRVLVTVLDTILRLLHPFTPFITEELYQRLNELAPVRGLYPHGEKPTDGNPWAWGPTAAATACIVAEWPSGLESWRDAGLEARFTRLQETIVAVRNVRSTYNITSAATLELLVRCRDEVATDLHEVASQFMNLAKTTLVAAGPEVVRPKASAAFTLTDADGFVPLEGLIDRVAELARQKKEAEKLRGFITSGEKKLENKSFVDRAPPEVVAESRANLEQLKKQLASVEEIVRQLEV